MLHKTPPVQGRYRWNVSENMRVRDKSLYSFRTKREAQLRLRRFAALETWETQEARFFLAKLWKITSEGLNPKRRALKAPSPGLFGLILSTRARIRGAAKGGLTFCWTPSRNCF